MELTGERRIDAPREKVWAALNDPDILRQAIPGCEELTPAGENRFDAVAATRIGPVSARFKGAVELEDVDAPHGYVLKGEGKGGPAGFARGEAKVTLNEVDGGAATVLVYAVSAKVGGKLAQIGGRVIDGAARAMADSFFASFAELVTAEETALPAETPGPRAEARPALAPYFWILSLLLAVALLLLVFGVR